MNSTTWGPPSPTCIYLCGPLLLALTGCLGLPSESSALHLIRRFLCSYHRQPYCYSLYNALYIQLSPISCGPTCPTCSPPLTSPLDSTHSGADLKSCEAAQSLAVVYPKGSPTLPKSLNRVSPRPSGGPNLSLKESQSSQSQE